MPPTFAPLPSAFRIHLDSLRIPYAVAAYRAGAVIYRQADVCDSVLQVQVGRVRLSVRERGGKEGVVGLVGPGGFLGEEALGGVPERRETATAITPVNVLVVAKAQMLRLLHTDDVASEQFLAHLLVRHLSLESGLADQLLLSSEQRVARCLLDLPSADANWDAPACCRLYRSPSSQRWPAPPAPTSTSSCRSS